MDSIFHEKQEGSLCAQHCLNALLQGHYFTAVDLGEIAQQLDETERQQMAEGGIDSEEYKRFIEQPSTNMDDSGFFSIQVISNAVAVWNLDTVTYNSQNPVSVRARENPCVENAYICNFREHWFTIRKLGCQWFNLNSLLTGPELVSDTYLKLLLAQLQQEGYSIFVVVGRLPDCEADQVLKLMPAVQRVKPKLIQMAQQNQNSGSGSGQSTGPVSQDDLQRALSEGMGDEELQQAMKASFDDDCLRDKSLQNLLRITAAEAEELELQRALQMSVEGYSSSSTPVPSCDFPRDSDAKNSPSLEELRQRRLNFLENHSKADCSTSLACASTNSEEMSEKEMLDAAIKMSLET